MMMGNPEQLMTVGPDMGLHIASRGKVPYRCLSEPRRGRREGVVGACVGLLLLLALGLVALVALLVGVLQNQFDLNFCTDQMFSKSHAWL